MSAPDLTTRLVDYLCGIPAFADPANRSMLLHSLPPEPVSAIPRHQAPRTDLHRIIREAQHMGRLPGSGQLAIEVVLANAVPFIRGTQHEGELDALRQACTAPPRRARPEDPGRRPAANRFLAAAVPLIFLTSLLFPSCERRNDERRLADLLAGKRWVAYDPPPIEADGPRDPVALIKGDLVEVGRSGFAGIVTYGGPGARHTSPSWPTGAPCGSSWS